MNTTTLLSILILFILLVSGCTSLNSDNANASIDKSSETAEKNTESETWQIEGSVLNGLAIEDNQLLYDNEQDTDVDYVYVTILPTYDDNGAPILFDDLNKIRDYQVEAPRLNIVFETGDINGPNKNSVSYQADQSNATIALRGHSTRRALQKSYKIRLDEKTDPWHGQRTLNLNKHPWDATRILNALAFDLLEEIPNITSMQTKFVKLYVRDRSVSPDATDFVDYGYFTHIEQPNKTFLESHGLDKSGSLYKIELYEFRKDMRLKSENSPDYDEAAFEQLIEIKEGNNHEKLLEMIDAVNDYSRSIDDVIDTYFQEDNYLTWLAFNILVGNYDARTQNYFLYSPSNASTWYLLAWDFDGAFGNSFIRKRMDKNLYFGKRHQGLANYWASVLHSRYFRYRENVDKLSNKIEEVYQYMTEEKMQKKQEKYYAYYYQAVTSLPDFRYLYAGLQDSMKKFDAIKTIPTLNKAAYYQSLEEPMPVFMSEVIFENDASKFRWDPSFDLQGDEISYKVEISKTPQFDRLVYQKVLPETELEVKHLEPGRYYWRLTITDSQGHYQYPFDIYTSEDGKLYQGVKVFVVPQN